MSISARVPSGVPAGGQFATSTKGESNLSLVVSDPSSAVPSDREGATVAPMPDHLSLVERWPNRRQRLDRLNEEYYSVAVGASAPGPDRAAAARFAVRDTFESLGSFRSLPEDDGAAVAYVFVGMGSDQKIAEAIDRVGTLADHEKSTFGDRIAGALFDIETEAHDRALASAAPVQVSPEDASREPSWPSWGSESTLA